MALMHVVLLRAAMNTAVKRSKQGVVMLYLATLRIGACCVCEQQMVKPDLLVPFL